VRRSRRATVVVPRWSPRLGPLAGRRAARLAAVSAAVAVCLVAGPGMAAADPPPPTSPVAAEPAVTQPAATQPAATQPVATEAGDPADPAPVTDPADPSVTAPEAPSEEEVRAAQQAADAVVERLAGLADRLASAKADVDAAHAASAIALDTHQAEQAEYEAAQAAADAADLVAQEAGAALAAARTELAAFARAGYIQGTTSPQLQALLSSRDPAQLFERLTLLGHAGGEKSDVLVRFTVAQHVAEGTSAAAEETVSRAAALRQRAADALAAAEELEAGARRQAEQVEQERAGLLAELVQAQEDLVALLGDADAALEYERRLAGIEGALDDGELDVALGELAGAGSPPAVAAAIEAALRAVGTPYAWGGGTLSGPGAGFGVDAGVVGFDCSGLTRYAYAQADVGVARNSRAQYATLPKVARADLRPGDLVFWANDVTDPTTIHHVALYLGSGRIVEAPHSGARVSVRPMYWSGYIGAVRPTA
jgi:cell wall-associated NlpC family hydrolase